MEFGKERSFGLLVGGIFALLSLLWIWRGRHPVGSRAAAILAAVLLISAVAAPVLLKFPLKLWLRIGSVLGWINSRIVLSIVFSLLFVPLGFILRCLGWDPLRRPSAQRRQSGWMPYPSRIQQRTHYERMY